MIPPDHFLHHPMAFWCWVRYGTRVVWTPMLERAMARRNASRHG